MNDDSTRARFEAFHLGRCIWVVAFFLLVAGSIGAQGQTRRSQKQIERDEMREKLRAGIYPLSATGGAAAPLTTGAVDMKTVRILSRASVDVSFWTIYGAYIKDFERQVVLRTRLKNMDTRTRDLDLETLFIGESPTGRDRYIFAKTNEIITLKSGEWTERVRISPVLTARVIQYIAPGGGYYYQGYDSNYSVSPTPSYGVKITSGHKIEGYIVRVLESKALMAVDTSNQYLRDEARDETVIRDWLKLGGLLPQTP